MGIGWYWEGGIVAAGEEIGVIGGGGGWGDHRGINERML